jgi:DeoR family fructose operon transcriptional repressor
LTRVFAHAEAKTRIGRAAAQLISDGETLIINGGSTTFAFSANLGTRRNLKVVTDNVAMLSVMPPEALESVYLLGGNYRIELASTVGLVGFSPENISADTAVLGVSGLTAKDGLSTTIFEEALMVAQMISCAGRTIVIADESKFRVRAFAQIAPFAAIDILVTDAPPPADLSQALSDANVEVIVAAA